MTIGNGKKNFGRSPSWREQLIAELRAKPIGFIQIIDPLLEETHYWGEVESNVRAIDIWIGEEHNLNKGYGTEMMRLAIKRCFANDDVKYILVDPLASNVRAHQFYESMGFRFVEERVFGIDLTHVWVYIEHVITLGHQSD